MILFGINVDEMNMHNRIDPLLTSLPLMHILGIAHYHELHFSSNNVCFADLFLYLCIILGKFIFL